MPTASLPVLSYAAMILTTFSRRDILEVSEAAAAQAAVCARGRTFENGVEEHVAFYSIHRCQRRSCDGVLESS